MVTTFLLLNSLSVVFKKEAFLWSEANTVLTSSCARTMLPLCCSLNSVSTLTQVTVSILSTLLKVNRFYIYSYSVSGYCLHSVHTVESKQILCLLLLSLKLLSPFCPHCWKWTDSMSTLTQSQVTVSILPTLLKVNILCLLLLSLKLLSPFCTCMHTVKVIKSYVYSYSSYCLYCVHNEVNWMSFWRPMFVGIYSVL